MIRSVRRSMAAASKGLSSPLVVDWDVLPARGRDRDPSRIIGAFAGGKAREWFYHQMLLEDLDLAAQYRRRILAVLALPRQWHAPVEGRKAGKLVDLCHRVFGRPGAPGTGIISNFFAIEKTLLKSLATGIEVAELQWEKIGGKFAGMWAPVWCMPKPISRFCMKDRELHVLGRNREPIPAPAGKFLVFRDGDVNDSGWPEASLDYIYTTYRIQKDLRAWEMSALERFGSPTVVVYYNAATTEIDGRAADVVNEELQQRALDLAEAVQSDFAAAIPDGFKVDVITTLGNQNFFYQDPQSQNKRAIARYLSGEINTSGLRPGTGAFASDTIAADILEQNLFTDAAVVEAAMSHWAKTLAEVNFGDADLAPEYRIDESAASDRVMRQNAMKLALEAGVEISEEEFRAVHQLAALRPGESTVKTNQGAPRTASTSTGGQ